MNRFYFYLYAFISEKDFSIVLVLPKVVSTNMSSKSNNRQL